LARAASAGRGILKTSLASRSALNRNYALIFALSQRSSESIKLVRNLPGTFVRELSAGVKELVSCAEMGPRLRQPRDIEENQRPRKW
jgi:hypothetical protein